MEVNNGIGDLADRPVFDHHLDLGLIIIHICPTKDSIEDHIYEHKIFIEREEMAYFLILWHVIIII